MKGRKIDSEFISEYISNCIRMNICSSEQIIAQVKKEVNDIDEKIKEVNRLKLLRGKLQDVISAFEKEQKIDNKEEKDTLSFFSIKDHNLCKKICDMIDASPTGLAKFSNVFFKEEDVIFAIKQMLECKILRRKVTHIFKGDNFDHYKKYINWR